MNEEQRLIWLAMLYGGFCISCIFIGIGIILNKEKEDK